MTGVLVSAGEASGDLYAAELVTALKGNHQKLSFFGCPGDRMEAAGVEPVIRASSLGVVGLVEVVAHLPRIYGAFRKLVSAAKSRRPAVAILTDSPDFNLRVARQMKLMGVPVVYLIAPQVWAWRQKRVRKFPGLIDHLLCIFPFEEPWFRERGVNATYIGHPLTHIVRRTRSREEFFSRHRLDPHRPLVVLLPGSRVGEVSRHLPVVADAAVRLKEAQCLLATPAGFSSRAGARFFRERIPASSIQVVEGETSDALAHATVAMAASGTVTVEAAVLGTPMVTFYRVSPLSWALGRRLVRVPYLTMVNLIAGRMIVPELMQNEATGERLAAEVQTLLVNSSKRDQMKRELARVTEALRTPEHPMVRAAAIAGTYLP
ncbi:MAG: lipid-A-disaccharide synthase [Bryobacteraceae bacterium]|nr:lipid-A-disaccharide synthase [Bryobacteraceae bacterium]